MAQKKTTTTTTKKTAAKSGGSKSTSSRTKKTQSAPPAKKPIRREVGGGFLLMLTLCTLVSYFGVSAIFLDALAGLLKGLFGYGYYLAAPAMGLAGVILVRHRGKPVQLRVTCT
ncbi:MAG: DNA translocase FtsK, partial [Oscillibacter sp.]|nr:DNA translocase FtsK [Oscillibacter sp.]